MSAAEKLDQVLAELGGLRAQLDAVLARLPAPGTQRAQAPATNVSASGQAFKFGRLKGQALDGAPLKDLEWYRGAIAKGIDDPEKSRWRDDNVALVALLNRLIVAAGGQAVAVQQGLPASSSGGAPEVDDIPFAALDARLS